jgi:hypothetical protein
MRIKFSADSIDGVIFSGVVDKILEFTDENKLDIVSATLYANIKTRSLKPMKVVVKENNHEVEWYVQKNEFTKVEAEDCQFVAEVLNDDNEVVGYLYKREIV